MENHISYDKFKSDMDDFIYSFNNGAPDFWDDDNHM